MTGGISEQESLKERQPIRLICCRRFMTRHDTRLAAVGQRELEGSSGQRREFVGQFMARPSERHELRFQEI